MKLLVDLFACQTYSRFRGIGRYTFSLIRQMAQLRGQNEMVTVADVLYNESFEELRQEFIQVLPAGCFLPYYHNSLEHTPWLNTNPYSSIAESLIEQAYQTISPDIVLTPSLFEGWGGGTHGMVPLPHKKYPNQKKALILYDLIPLIFQKQYLDPDPPLKKWYLERIELLQNYDLLLAISEATRQDAINILGIHPDKIVNILGAAGPHFKKLNLLDEQRRSFLKRFGISRPFVLYIGGNDFRKNMDGALRAFANLPRNIIKEHQLVLNDVGDETFFRTKAHKLGLDDSDLVILKRISEDELVALYNLTKLFIFPSLYEGFGLPVLEAMSCGTPVLASNNSSLPEVVGRSDALFNINDERDVANSINRALTDDSFRNELAAHGFERAKKFNWATSAKQAWDAIEMLTHGEKQDWKSFPSDGTKNLRLLVAYVSPFPPQKSGIAEYSATLLPYLGKHFDIHVFVQPGLQVSDEHLKSQLTILPWTELINRSAAYDAVIYHMGNSEFHIPMLDLIQEVPGIIVNHDFYNGNLPFVKGIRTGDRSIFIQAIDQSHGLKGVIDYELQGVDVVRWKWPMNWKVLKSAQKLMVHSIHQNELLDNFYRYGWRPQTRLVKQHREYVPEVSQAKKDEYRKELGLKNSTFIYCSFGFMAPTKLNNETIVAFSKVISEIKEDIELIFVGDIEGGEYGLESLDLIKKLGLSKRVRITGFVNNQDYEKYLVCADVAIQLRTDSRGETSRAVLDCLAFGLPTILNAHGSFNDYDPADVIKLPEMPEIDELADAMIMLKTDAGFRHDKGYRARKYIQEQHDPAITAAAIAAEIFQASKTREEKILGPLVEGLYQLDSSREMLETSARYAAQNLSLRCQPTILINVTGLEDQNWDREQQKSTLDFINEIININDSAIKIDLVLTNGEECVRANRIVEKIFRLPINILGPNKSISIQPGDIFVELESFLLNSIYNSKNTLELVRKKGGKNVAVVLDEPNGQSNNHILEYDLVLCASKYLAGKIKEIIPLLCKKIFYKDYDEKPAWVHSIIWLLDPSINEHIKNVDDVSITEPDIEETGTNKKLYFENGSSTHDLLDSSLRYDNGKVRLGLLKSCPCSQELLETDEFQMWVEKMKGRKHWMHRKLWEWAYISQALHERDLLKAGMRGLGFAVGQEPLPALFASFGCEITATDLATEQAGEKGWVVTNQHAVELKDLNKAQICPDDLFEKLVSFRFADMNQIDSDLQGFDFVWSSCSLEHLGSLDHGKQFIYNAMDCLKPGGVAIHTTEFNISSNEATLEKGPDVIYRKKDFEEIVSVLRSKGHKIEIDFTLGGDPSDLFVDVPPYKQDIHLRLSLSGYTCTSFGLIIQKAN